MSSREPSHAPAGIPLQALVAELGSRCEAASRLQGGSAYFHEELGIFSEFAAGQNLFLQDAPDELSRVPDEEGNEHQVWYRPDEVSFLKATWPDFFGLLVVHRPNEEHKALPSPIWNAGRSTTNSSAMTSGFAVRWRPNPACDS